MNGRYSRQEILPEIGREGQKRLAASRAAVIGCGALGTVMSDLLVRMGVGYIEVIDRDVVELSNLQRQILYDESDIGRPKAEATAGSVQSDKEMLVFRVDDMEISLYKDGGAMIRGTEDKTIARSFYSCYLGL